MATLKTILEENSGNLVEVIKGNTTEKINRVTATTVFMDSGASYSINNSGWELKRPPLDEQKAERVNEIDLNTQRLIAEGFVHNDTLFSLSLNAQQNWTAMSVMLLTGKLTFPNKITNKNDLPYYLQDAAEFITFTDKAVYAVQSQLEYGRQLKAAVLLATTQQELDAVVDPR